jgi:hypothetical protein
MKEKIDILLEIFDQMTDKGKDELLNFGEKILEDWENEQKTSEESSEC